MYFTFHLPSFYLFMKLLGSNYIFFNTYFILWPQTKGPSIQNTSQNGGRYGELGILSRLAGSWLNPGGIFARSGRVLSAIAARSCRDPGGILARSGRNPGAIAARCWRDQGKDLGAIPARSWRDPGKILARPT